MFEEAEAIRQTMHLCKLTQSELAKQLGVSQSYVANKLRLLTLSKEMTEKIVLSGISERHARSLLRLATDGERLLALDEITSRHLTVRECEALVDGMVMRSLPKRITRSDVLDAIADFKDVLRSASDVLRSLGIKIRSKTSYLGEDMYITVVIKEV
jgi:ParB family chromosome partitioning protein